MKRLLFLLAMASGIAHGETLIFHDSECALQLPTGDIRPATGFDSVCKVDGKDVNCRYTAQDSSTTSTGRLVDLGTENPNRVRVLVSPGLAEQVALRSDGSYLWKSSNNRSLKTCEGNWTVTK